MMPEEETRQRGSLAGWVTAAGKLAIVALAVWLAVRLLREVRWADLEARLEGADWPPIGLALFLLVARFLVWDVRWYLAMRRVAPGGPRLARGFFALLASAAVNLVTPSVRLAGGLVRARYTAQDGEAGFGHAYGVVLFDQLAHNAVMTALSLAALVVTAFALGYRTLGWSALAALAVAGAVVAVWSRRGGDGAGGRLARALARRAEAAGGRIGRLLAHSHDAVQVFARLFADRALRWQVAALGGVFFVVNAMAQWLIFRGLGAEVSPAVVVGAVSLGLAAGTLTGAPGGIGATEAAMVATFAALGVGSVDAAAGTLLYRGLHYAVVLALGLPALVGLELRLSLGRARNRGNTASGPR